MASGGTRKNTEKSKCTKKCNVCGKTGHKSTDSWQKEENKHKHPAWMAKKKITQANVNNGNRGPKVEFLLCGMTFSGDQRMLTDPNIWIADTSTTVHILGNCERKNKYVQNMGMPYGGQLKKATTLVEKYDNYVAPYT